MMNIFEFYKKKINFFSLTEKLLKMNNENVHGS